MKDLTTSSTIEIDAPATRVWDALTTRDLIRRWFFGVDTETDWTVGGPIVHRGEFRGEPYEDKGTIVAFEPGRRLVHTHWSAASGLPDAPEHYQEVVWELSGSGGATRLTVSETNLPSEEAMAVSQQAWGSALGALKRLVEG